MSIFPRPPRRGSSLPAVLFPIAIATLIGLLVIEVMRYGFPSPMATAWIVILGLVVLLYVFVLDRDTKYRSAADKPGSEEDRLPAGLQVPPEEIDEIILAVMNVEAGGMEGDIPVAKGRLTMDPDRAFAYLEERCEPYGYQPMLRPLPGGRVHLALIPRAQLPPPLKSNPVINLVLLLATVGTTTYAGARLTHLNPLSDISYLKAGLPYSLSLLLILGFHEFGHYFAARFHRMAVTLPYFIPFPGGLGTFGAFIQMRSMSRNRRALFDVAVAGPLAGLVATFPVLILGFQDAKIIPPLLQPWFRQQEGSFKMDSYLMHLVEQWVVQAEGTVLANPLILAGYLGLFVTAINLFPIGQLDGGHIARALFGHRAGSIIGAISLAALFIAALTVRPDLLPWAIMVLVMASARPTPPLNEVSRAGPLRYALGLFSFVILGLILWPAPA